MWSLNLDDNGMAIADEIKPTSLRIPPILKAQLEEAAEANGVKLSKELLSRLADSDDEKLEQVIERLLTLMLMTAEGRTTIKDIVELRQNLSLIHNIPKRVIEKVLGKT